MRELQEESRQVRQFALELEDHRAASRAAAAHEDRVRHEETMHMFRSALNPHAEAIAAMHAGAASLNQAAQSVAENAAHHRAMAADASHLFTLSIHRGIEAMQVAASSGGPPPPPGGAAVQTAAQRPDELVLPVAPQPPTIDSGMASAKRAVSPLEEVEGRVEKAMRRARSAASQGAARAASANAVPATKEEEQPAAPGHQPEASEPERAVRPYSTAQNVRPRVHRMASTVRRGRGLPSAMPAQPPNDESGGGVLPIIIALDDEPRSASAARHDSRPRRKSPARSRSKPKRAESIGRAIEEVTARHARFAR
jgi:hypothetical protein